MKRIAAAAVTASLWVQSAAGSDWLAYISDVNARKVFIYGSDGHVRGTVPELDTGNVEMQVGPDGKLYALGMSTNPGRLSVYDPVTELINHTQTTIRSTFEFGPDGNIYSWNRAGIGSPYEIRKHAPDGTFIGSFATTIPTDRVVVDFVFGPNNDIFLLERTEVSRLSFTTGTYMGSVAWIEPWVTTVVEICYASDGNFYVSNDFDFNHILKINPTTGYQGFFGSGTNFAGITFGPDNVLYQCADPNSIKKYNLAGELLGRFTIGDPLIWTRQIKFGPTPEPSGLAVLIGGLGMWIWHMRRNCSRNRAIHPHNESP